MSRFPLLASLSSALLLTGCGLTSVSKQAEIVTPVANTISISGNVHGGNQPVTGATIQLWEIGINGYGAAPTQLGTSAISDPNGNYSITGDYNCSNGTAGGNTTVYITATGGNPGLTAGTNNSAIVMMAPIGFCSSLTPSTFIIINEVTTVAAVYALQQFMNSSGGIGTNYGYAQGIVNAFGIAGVLVNTATGQPRTSFNVTTKVFPAATINTLANILVPCVNSASPSSSACASLFADATPPSQSAPTNILLAALDIARNPVQLGNPNYISNLFNLSTTNPAFQPTLATAPNDWTLSLGYAQGPPPTSLAIDATDSVWTVGTNPSNSISYITEMGPRGATAFNSPYTNSSFNGAYGLAIDSSGYAWVTNSGGNSLMQLQFASSNITPINVYNSIGLNSPKGVMIDGNANAWIANSGNNSVTEFNTAGTSAAIQFTAGGLSAPVALASDLYGNTWVTNSTGGSITSIPQYSNSSVGYAAHTGGGLSTPYSIAIDANSNTWVTDSVLGEVAKLNNGTPLSTSSGYTGGGLTPSFADAIDGAGNLWVANYSGNSLTELLPTGTPATPSTGFVGGLGSPKSLAIDQSGNIWVGNSAPVAGATITEFIGLAAPAVAPLVSGIQTGQQGKRPGTLSITGGFQSNAQIGIAYSDTFSATGGSGSYSWSMTSGLSALQAIGLNFSSSGTLSGTPTGTGSFNFTIQVSDTTLTSASQSYTLVVSIPPATACTHDGSGNALLNGHYAFLLSGFDPNGHFYDEIGSFKADGSGHLSSGDADVNGDQNLTAFASGEQQYNFTGTYSIGSTDDRGILNFANSNGIGTAGLPANTSFCFAADAITGGVAYSGRLIQADGSGYMLTGFFNIQNSADFAPSAISGGYVFGLQGVDGTTPNRRGMIGQFAANGTGAITSGQIDTSGANYNGVTYTNTYSAANAVANTSTYTLGANGRGTMTFNVGGTPMPFIVYMTGNGTQLFLLSQNASATGTTPLLVGKALIQLQSNFTTANVAGAGVFRSAATSNPNNPPLADKDGVGQLTFDGAGNASFVADMNSGGNIGDPSTNSGIGTYSVSPIGYLSLGGFNNPPNFYLYAPGGGFGLDSSVGVTSFYMNTQTIPSGGFTNANLSTSLAGSYAIGTVFPLTYNITSSLLDNGTQYPTIFDGEVNFASGTFSGTQDTVIAPGSPAIDYVATGSALSGTYNLDPTYGPASGRFLTQNSGQNSVVGYIINSLSAFALTITSGQNPQLVEADHH